MSNIDDLKIKVQSLTDQLNSATTSLHEAMIAEAPLLVGDLVSVNRNGRLEYGKIVGKKVKYGEVDYEIAKPTKKGFHATARVWNWRGEGVTKISEIPA